MGVKFVEGEVTDLTVEGDKVKDIKVIWQVLFELAFN